MTENQILVDKRRSLIKRGEGCITHMYLDTKGKVTVGVGNMLPGVSEALELPFINRESREPGTPEEITKDFRRVADQKPGRVAGSYKAFTSLDLEDDAIDALLDRRIGDFEAGLRRNFPGYDDYPQACRLALMDMVFNLGNNGLVTKFPSLTRAAREQDWEECANQCRRKGISEERNDEIRMLFESLV